MTDLSEFGLEGFNLTADLDKADIPAGKYLCTVKSVEFRQNPKVKDGENIVTRGLNITLQIDASDYPALADYHGAFLNSYIWLGNHGKIERSGLQGMKRFLSAVTGVEQEGEYDWKGAGGLQKKEDGKLYLTTYEGMPVGVEYGLPRNAKDDRLAIIAWIPADDLKPLDDEDGEEPF